MTLHPPTNCCKQLHLPHSCVFVRVYMYVCETNPSSGHSNFDKRKGGHATLVSILNGRDTEVSHFGQRYFDMKTCRDWLVDIPLYFLSHSWCWLSLTKQFLAADFVYWRKIAIQTYLTLCGKKVTKSPPGRIVTSWIEYDYMHCLESWVQFL